MRYVVGWALRVAKPTKIRVQNMRQGFYQLEVAPEVTTVPL